jgi:L-ascorbate metabolism protein UlaG (beta-lactamase superfamily)
LKIIWHGHSCFEIRDDVTMVLDPHDGKSIGIKPPTARADVVLMSHDHFDHNCSRIIRGDHVDVMASGQRTVKGVEIVGIDTFHDDSKGEKRGRNIVYRFVLDEIRFCHCGDLGHLLTEEDVEAIGEVDILFIPVGGVFTIDAAQAHKVIEMLDPRIVVPMHYRMGGLSIAVNTLDEFLAGVDEETVLRVGNEIDFSSEDMMPGTEYWVFSP